MEAELARKILLDQHDRIRTHLDRCSVLGRRLRNGEPLLVELDEALATLRADFAVHNTTESELVRPLLHESPGWGNVLVDRMLEEHVAEHAAFWELLSGPVDEVVTRIDDLVDELDAHMAAEERTFLSPLVLHPDAISRHRRQEPT
jgi:iron-sulfur cluster repair protein YtfE (RIC family)